MSKFAALFALLVAALACGLFAAPAQAQRARVFVASYGSDSNPCTFGSPCKTFQRAHDAVAAGGEITAIDSAGFGPIAISHAVTITSPAGIEAGIQAVSGGNAITVNPSASITVTLHGLTLEGSGVGQNGIALTATAPGTLNIIDCVVNGFISTGILATPAYSGNNEPFGNLLIADSVVLNNGSSGIKIASQNVSTELQFRIDRTLVANNGTSGNDGGIVIDSGSGFHYGTISSVAAEMNSVALNFTGSGGVGVTRLRNSTLENSHQPSGAGPDLVLPNNGEQVYLFDSNQITVISNQGNMFSDGTNDIIDVVGNSPAAFARQ